MISKKDFVGLYTKLCCAYSKEFSQEQCIIYWEQLGKFDMEQLQKAANHCLRQCKFFPTIADIFESIPREYHQLKKLTEGKIIPMPDDLKEKLAQIGKKGKK